MTCEEEGGAEEQANDIEEDRGQARLHRGRSRNIAKTRRPQEIEGGSNFLWGGSYASVP